MNERIFDEALSYYRKFSMPHMPPECAAALAATCMVTDELRRIRSTWEDMAATIDTPVLPRPTDPEEVGMLHQRIAELRRDLVSQELDSQ